VNTADPVLDFRTREQWRRWLEENHDKSQGEWVYMYKKAAKAGLRYKEALDEALCFGWIDGQIKAVDKDKFRQRWTPRRKGGTWSDGNKRRVRELALAGCMAEPGKAAVRAAKKTGAWNLLSQRSVGATPPDLARALKAAPRASANFERFPRSARVGYVWWVVSAKRPETRRRRVEAVVRRAHENRKPGMDSPYS
jgi:uncharacterized protein YdeI (YjbR/CyaY-like superfamily)